MGWGKVQEGGHVCVLVADSHGCMAEANPILYSDCWFVQMPSRVRLFATPWTTAHQASLSFNISRSLLRLMFIQPSHPLSSPSPPDFSLSQHQASFPVSWLLASGGQSTGASASASVLPNPHMTQICI